MPLEKFPVVTRDDVVKARNDQLATLGATVAVAAGLTAANYRLNAPGGFKVQFPLKALTGVNATPTASGRAAIRLPLVGVIAGLAPAPLGFVPGEQLGLHPAVVRRTLGFSAGKKPVVFEPSSERIKVFEAKIEAERIAGRVLNQPVIFGLSGGFPNFKIPAGPLNITDAELTFLESLPPDITNAQKLIPGLRARRSDFRIDPLSELDLPAGASPVAIPEPFPLAATVPSASIQPEHIQPVNAAALANQAAAEGIRAALVHERADP